MGLAREGVRPFASRPRVDAERRVLVGSRCAECGTLSWPARAICNRCGDASLELTDLPTEGTLLAYTTVWVARPGLEPPYVLGQVNLGRGARLFAHVRSLHEAEPVPVQVRLAVPAPGTEPIEFWFEPL